MTVDADYFLTLMRGLYAAPVPQHDPHRHLSGSGWRLVSARLEKLRSQPAKRQGAHAGRRPRR